MSHTKTGAVSPPVDLADLIDANPMSGLQWRIVVLCMLAAILDGADTFSIGVAAPSIAAKMGMPLPTFGAVFSAAQFGAAGGAFAFGPLADRFGRRLMLVVAVLIFAIFTFATALADSRGALIAVRVLAGVGLGGATPCFLSLASEYAPARIRASVTTLLWAGFPLGGMLGGFLNSYLLTNFEWPMLFYVGGILPVVVALAISTLAPEAPSFLVGRPGAGVTLAEMAGRIAPALAGQISAGTRFIQREVKLAGVPIRYLFEGGRGPVTLLLWIPFFLTFGLLVLVVLWSPAMQRNAGMSGPNAALVVAFHGLGGFIGMASSGKLLEKFGPFVLVPALLAGAICTLLFGTVGTSVPLAALFDGLIGVFIGIAAAGSIGLASWIYPTSIRSTGIGWAMAMGRVGQVVAPLLAGAVLQIGWKVDELFLALAVAPVLAALIVPLLARRVDRKVAMRAEA